MQEREITAKVVLAILAANRGLDGSADPYAVRRLEVDWSGQLWCLNLAMNEGSVIGRFVPEDAQGWAVGYTEFDELDTVHPLYGGSQPTVAEVLAQLPEAVREQVTGVQFAGGKVRSFSTSTANGLLPMTWRVERTRLYRRSRAVAHVVRQPLVLPEDAFDGSGQVQLHIAAGCRPDGTWDFGVLLVRPDGQTHGEPIGDAWAAGTTEPGAGGDVLEAARRWIIAALPEGTVEVHYRCFSRIAFGDETDKIAGAQMRLQRLDLLNV